MSQLAAVQPTEPIHSLDSCDKCIFSIVMHPFLQKVSFGSLDRLAPHPGSSCNSQGKPCCAIEEDFVVHVLLSIFSSVQGHLQKSHEGS